MPARLQMPFIKKAPRVSFRKAIGSVSVSGHKFIGAPVPCGVVITRQKVWLPPHIAGVDNASYEPAPTPP